MSVLSVLTNNYMYSDEYYSDLTLLNTQKLNEARETHLKTLKEMCNEYFLQSPETLFLALECLTNSLINESDTINFIMGFKYASKLFKELYGGALNE